MRHSEWTRTRTFSVPVDVALDERDVLLARERLAVGDGLEVAVVGRQPDGDDALDELLGALAVLDQVGDRDDLQAVALAELDEVGHAGHRPVVVHDLADDAGRGEAREPREVDGRLRLPRALEHAAGAGAEREHVTRDGRGRAASRSGRWRPGSCARGRRPRCPS